MLGNAMAYLVEKSFPKLTEMIIHFRPEVWYCSHDKPEDSSNQQIMERTYLPVTSNLYIML